jgi:hypothetical protein
MTYMNKVCYADTPTPHQAQMITRVATPSSKDQGPVQVRHQGAHVAGAVLLLGLPLALAHVIDVPLQVLGL